MLLFDPEQMGSFLRRFQCYGHRRPSPIWQQVKHVPGSRQNLRSMPRPEYEEPCRNMKNEQWTDDRPTWTWFSWLFQQSDERLHLLDLKGKAWLMDSRCLGEHVPSRSTLVRTIYPKPHLEIASAVCSGSWGSKGGGARDVFTEQNLHPLVHVSPMSLQSLQCVYQ